MQSTSRILNSRRLCRQGFQSEVRHMLKVFVSTHNRLAMLREEQGQTMAEYGVVLAVIAVIVVVALTALSGGITGALNKVTAIL